MGDRARLDPQACLSYTGGPIEFLDGETIVYRSGAGLHLHKFSGNGHEEGLPFVWSPTQAVDAYAVNHRRSLLAFAPKQIDPTIMILSYPKVTERGKLIGGARLGYAFLAFSRDGERLAGLGHALEPKLFVWAIDTESLMTQVDMPALCCSFLSFNPADGDYLIAGGQSGVIFWCLNKNVDDSFNAIAINANLSVSRGKDGEEEEEKTGPTIAASAHSNITAHCWTVDNRVMLANTVGELLVVEAKNGDIVERVQLSDESAANTDCRYVSLLLTLTHIVETSLGGSLRWRSLKDLTRVERTAIISSSQQQSSVSSVACSPMFDKVLVGTTQGGLYDVGLEVSGMESMISGHEEVLMEMDVLGQYHQGPVLALASLCSDNDLIASAGQDGYLRIWEGGIDCRLAVSEQFLWGQDHNGGSQSTSPMPITSLAGMNKQRVLAVGTAGGKVSLFYIDEEPTVSLTTLYSERFYTKAISHLAFSDNDAFLAMGSAYGEPAVHVLTCLPSLPFQVIGSWTNAGVRGADGGGELHTLSSIAWQGSVLLFADTGGYLYATNSSEQSPGASQPLWWTKLGSFSPMALVSLPYNKGLCALNATNHSLQTYKAADVKDKAPSQLPLLASGPPHEKSPLCMTLSQNGKYLATASADGAVALYWVGDGGKQLAPKKIHFLPLHQGPVVALAFSRRCCRLFSAGLDGDIMQIQMDGVDEEKHPGQRPGFDKVKQQFAAQGLKGTFLSHNEPTWSSLALQKQLAQEDAAREANKVQVRERLNILSKKLHQMLGHNNQAPELEQLDRESFIVNLQARDEQLETNEKQAQELRDKIVTEDMGFNLVRARILSTCWDSTEVHAKQIRLMGVDAGGGLMVTNFPLSKPVEADKPKLARVMQLRALELKDARQEAGRSGIKAWPDLLHEVPHGLSWVVNEGILKPTIDVLDLQKRIQVRVQQQQQQQATEQDPKGATTKSNQDEEEDDKTEEKKTLSGIIGLLYPPCAIRTPNQKRTQILLSLEFIRQIKKRFNDHFDALFLAKKEEMEKSDSRNDRLAEIMTELGLMTEGIVQKATWSSEGTIDHMLELTPSEIKVMPYETEVMREARRLLEEEKRKREAESSKENIGERALQDMMYGVLEGKSDPLASAQALEAPEWMSQLLVEQWTEEQKAEADAFEVRKKRIQEEVEKKRKELELELKRLVTEITDAYKAFDEKVKDLAELKLFAETVICQQELIVTRLAASLCHREETAIENRRLEVKMREVLELKGQLGQRIAAFRQHYDSFREEMDRVQNEDKALERNFRKDVQDSASTVIDQDTLKILLQLYKSRPRGSYHSHNNSLGGTQSIRGSFQSQGQSQGITSQRGSSRTSSKFLASRRKSTEKDETGSKIGVFRRRSSANAMKGGNNGGGGSNWTQGTLGQEAAIEVKRNSDPERQHEFDKDPFYLLDNATDRAKKASQAGLAPPEIVLLNQEVDCPDGFVVAEAVWNKLQELRASKIMKEYEVRKANLKLAELKKVYDTLVAEGESLDSQIGSMQAKKFDIAETMAFKEMNTELLVRLKQGQVEVGQEGSPDLTINYMEALLIPVNNVIKVNNEVVRLGTDKVKVLNRIKDFRKCIGQTAWEHRHLSQAVEDLEEHYKDLQLTRVTRNLQEMLDGNHVEKEWQKLQRGEARLGIIGKAHTDRIDKMKEVCAKVMWKVKDKEDENRRLEKKLKDLKLGVEAREAVYKSKVEGEGSHSTPASSKMRRISLRRRLIELARSQTEEVEFLRQELDRLKERSFPSFSSNVGRPHIGNPDEIY